MTWRTEKTRTGEDLVWSGVETGIAPSPHKGTANIQNANIATETGEVMASYGRTNQAQTSISGGTLTASVSDGDTLLDAPATLKAGTWIKVTASSITSITAATNPATADVTYLVVGGGGGGGEATHGTGAAGGGGGGGGAVRAGTLSASVTSYPITVGRGGAGAVSTGADGSLGEDSVFSTITSLGGGGGGGATDTTARNGVAGGSGGGGAASAGDASAGTGGTAGTGGNAGGAGTNSNGRAGGGGGGSAAGGTGTVSGNGGNGTSSSITGTFTIFGGGGGGGGSNGSGAGEGGTGGGGDGQVSTDGLDGTDGLGGGGGGGGAASTVGSDGGNGGSGIVIISYATGTLVATGGLMYATGGNTIHVFTSSGTFTVSWINPGGYYYVDYKNTSNKVKLATKFDPTGGNPITHGTSGTATFDTVATPGSGIAKATERYTTATATEYRYYILDHSGFVWVYDSAVYDASLAASGVGTTWMLPDPANYSSMAFTGMAVLNGFLNVLNSSQIFGKPTVDLGRGFAGYLGMIMNEPFPTHRNFAYVGAQGKMYYCDGNYIGEIFPTTSIITSVANIQSYCQYTSSGTLGTVTKVIGGSLPYDPTAETRIPAAFFTDVYGTMPSALTSGNVYYVEMDPSTKTFRVYNSITPGAGSALDIATGAAGNLYFNTFFPTSIEAGYSGSDATVQISTQRVNLPYYETANCMVELGNSIIIGCLGSAMYPWNQIDATPSDVINLPEAGVVSMLNVNNTGYVFAGNKGNVYVTNNSVAALAGKIPDYCAGVPGTPLTYIEPRFTWGDSTYSRGRVYCSILDQTSTKAGNCGGVWSFIPSENIDPNQALGMALRLENQNSYGNYSGYATILISNEEQDAISPQYWSSWQTSYSTGTSTFGIDYTDTVPVVTYVVETDLLPSGTNLDKTTFSQIEYKMATPLVSGDSVQLYYRLNATDAWATCGTVKEELTNRISGYFNQTFQKTQWTQLRAVVTTTGTTASSFGRLAELRIR